METTTPTRPRPSQPSGPQPGVVLRGSVPDHCREIVSPQALDFVADLARTFGPRVRELLAQREAWQARIDAGERPDFLAETTHIREADWKVAPLPADLLNRQVEITGPVDRKMVINALNSGADVFMADFEDSNAPTWLNNIEGQVNLRDAVAGTIRYVHPTKDKVYELGAKTATLMVRPRGWHLVEEHMVVDGQPVAAGLFDFGLYFFHNAHRLLANGTGPYFYLPKLQDHREAQLWNDVFVRAQRALAIPVGTIKATVLLETLPAAFQMNEILYALRVHSAGLNCGRWDYIFSFIKTLKADPKAVLPDRAQVGMTQPCMKAYTSLVIQTCHRRGVHAMGGMAAQIPIKNDPQANEAALAKVRADKVREATAGHDGTWVAHPGLVHIAREAFDAAMPGPNQIHRLREDVCVTAEDLLAVPSGTRTMAGLRQNIDVGVRYLAAWISGSGCVPLYNLMEDAATAEISRTQVWQWLHQGASLEDGTPVTAELVRSLLQELLADEQTNEAFRIAAQLFEDLIVQPSLADFLTTPAYRHLTTLTEES